ncbi:MAG: class I SAM-dependent methyltransferase [Bacteroidia bacterium]|nr:class I SAM-dependent methyltransferase [Bacteroidia bacterium]
MQCRVCESKTVKIFNSLVLHKYTVDYFHCPNCSFLQTEEPFWLDEAYSRPINLSDTGLLDRNIYFSKILSVLIYFFFDKSKSYLDYAGGYGVFTRLMRDIGFDFYWHDPYTKNLFANGFEIDKAFETKFEFLTAFEVFEHLINPKEELERMLQLSDTIIFSTELMPQEMPNPKDWWYYGFSHGQHVSFYAKKTFYNLADQNKSNYYNLNGIHIITKRKFNKTLLIVFKKLSKFGLYQIVKTLIKSKTFSDHTMIDNINYYSDKTK